MDGECWSQNWLMVMSGMVRVDHVDSVESGYCLAELGWVGM